MSTTINKELKIILELYREKGQSFFLKLISSRFEESKNLKKLLRYDSNPEVEKRIENNLSNLYIKISRNNKIHALEKLVRDWNTKNNFPIHRKKIFDKEAYKIKREISFEKFFLTKFSNLTFNQLREKVGMSKKIFTKILRQHSINPAIKGEIKKEKLLLLKDELVQFQQHRQEKFYSINEKKQKEIEVNENRYIRSLEKERNWLSEFAEKYDATRPIYTGMKD